MSKASGTSGKTCDRCGENYESNLEKCPECNSTITRPSWTIESEYIRASPPFSVHVNSGYEDDSQRVFQISKLVPRDEGPTYDSVNINTPEDFLDLMNAFNNLYDTTGWRRKSELLEELSADYQSRETIEEIVEQYPSFFNDVLETFDFEDMDEEDFEFLQEAIENLNDTILQAQRQVKHSFSILLEQLSHEDQEGFGELSQLLQEWNLLQITSTSNVLLSRLEFLESFEKMIHNEEVYELRGDDSVHRSLERNLWLLDEDYWLMQSNRSLRTFIQEEMAEEDKQYEQKRPDFVCATQGNRLVVAEIKRPSHELVRDDLDQLETYVYLARKYKGEEFSEVSGFLIGNSVDEQARQVVDNRVNMQIKTYHDVLSTARERYHEYLEALDENHPRNHSE